MRIKKLAAVAVMAVTMMGVGTGAQALLIDANDELGFLGAVLQGVDNAVDRETDELVTDEDSPVRDLATDDDSRLDDIIDGALTSDDALLLDDVEDALCIVFEGDTDPDCEDGDEEGDDDGLLDGLLGGILDEDGGVVALLSVGAFVGLF